MIDEKITPHFHLSEFLASQDAVRFGIDNIPSALVLANIRNLLAPGLQYVRDKLGHPISISSGYRCPELNTRVGGASNSDHMSGLAADFICPGYGSPKQVCEAIIRSGVGFDQLIHEGTWVHISFDQRPRCQVLTAHFRRGHKTTYTVGLS